jgi:ubiquinone/menaquinone biosynthesis C-methylase UbiE
MTKKINSWEKAYRKRPSGEVAPHQDVEYLHNLFKDTNVIHILDLGCGDGRHCIYFAERGYNITGFDYAPTALRRAREWLTKENLDAQLFCADMRAIPCADAIFDAVICIAVINHSRIKGIRKTIQEIQRLLHPEGWLFLVVATDISSPDSDNTKYKKIEHHTSIPLSGHEKGVPHYFFSEEELRGEFSQFEIQDIHTDCRNRACIVMQKKK